jgi:cytochrome c oxidase assembly protein subunit 11
MKKPNKNTRVLFGLAVIIGVMLGIVSQAQPLYQFFCGKTGYGGTTRTAITAPAQTKDRVITVNFDSNVDPALPWDFTPEQRSVNVKLGEEVTVKFLAHNRSSKTVTGTAVHNVQPDKAGLYFNKTQCFCFTKQVLKAGQSEDMPVKFFIDPALADDRNEDDITHMTLSYTFYLAKDGKKAHNAGADSAANP